VTIRLVLAEDNVIVREGMRSLFEFEDDLELVGSSDDLDGLLALVDAENPDVVVTAILAPGWSC
jgi:DNA-binding NarL/FixJ family response regulator